MVVYNPEVLDEVPGPEQKHEVVRGVLGCKGLSDESIDEEVGRRGALHTREVSYEKRRTINSNHLKFRHVEGEKWWLSDKTASNALNLRDRTASSASVNKTRLVVYIGLYVGCCAAKA